MNDKKNVKLFVFLLVLFLAGAVALGFIPSEDSQGSLHRVNPARSGMMQTDPSDIVNPGGLRAIQGGRFDVGVAPRRSDLMELPFLINPSDPAGNLAPSFPVR